MDRPFLDRLHIKGYGCIKDATFQLTPLHALIGPNDSGKSTVLRAIKTITRADRFFDPGRGRGEIAASSAATTAHFITEDTAVGVASGTQDVHTRARHAWREVELLRLDPDFLRTPQPLIADGQPLRFRNERGAGLPALYDALVVRDLPAYMALNQELTRLFLSVKSIQLGNPNQGEKAMGIRLVDGTYVPAELMSEGLLYYLAFAILPHLNKTSILLIEEPENGLHPARIIEVMRVLRKLSETTQILLATHSPIVVNELQPNEVTVVTRTPQHGTKATLMKDTKNFEERSKVYALGELWLSYANGEDEAPLIEGGPRP